MDLLGINRYLGEAMEARWGEKMPVWYLLLMMEWELFFMRRCLSWFRLLQQDTGWLKQQIFNFSLLRGLRSPASRHSRFAIW